VSHLVLGYRRPSSGIENGGLREARKGNTYADADSTQHTDLSETRFELRRDEVLVDGVQSLRSSVVAGIADGEIQDGNLVRRGKQDVVLYI
jgi:hypothetical protein